jgi:DNA-binding NtrC family response regulator
LAWTNKKAGVAAKILVVDDQENMCWILSKVLAEAGFAVETARSGKEALARVAEGGITAAIVDYRLPDMNGIQLLNRMQNVTSHIAAILITSYGSKALQQEALGAGFAGYLDKPFRNQALVDALKKALG